MVKYIFNQNYEMKMDYFYNEIENLRKKNW
jgi:hypothetical protein